MKASPPPSSLTRARQPDFGQRSACGPQLPDRPARYQRDGRAPSRPSPPRSPRNGPFALARVPKGEQNVIRGANPDHRAKPKKILRIAIHRLLRTAPRPRCICHLLLATGIATSLAAVAPALGAQGAKGSGGGTTAHQAKAKPKPKPKPKCKR